MFITIIAIYNLINPLTTDDVAYIFCSLFYVTFCHTAILLFCGVLYVRSQNTIVNLTEHTQCIYYHSKA